MKITVTKQHINSARSNGEQITPLELAVYDLEMFEEVKIRSISEDTFGIYIDDMDMVLPQKASKAVLKFMETGEMKPFSFNLDLEVKMNVPTVDLDILPFEESFEDSFDYGFDLGFA